MWNYLQIYKYACKMVFQILLGGDGCVLHLGLNGFPQNKNKVLGHGWWILKKI
jgi:hypothetical protein